MVQDLTGEHLRLRCGQMDAVSLLDQTLQHLGHPGIDLIFKHPLPPEVLAVFFHRQCDTGAVSRKIAGKGLLERRTDEEEQAVCTGPDPEMVQRIQDGIDDALLGIGDGAVKIEKERSMGHRHIGGCDYEECCRTFLLLLPLAAYWSSSPR